MRYRRAFVSDGSFFFTLVTEERRPLFASAEAVDVLRGFNRCSPLARLRLMRYVKAGIYEAGWGQGQMNFEDTEYE